MQKLVLSCALLVVALAATTADAAAVYFRGAVTTAIGGDPLGIMALPNQVFESLVTTDGAGNVTGSYIVFFGKSFNFSSGTFGAVGPNNGFTNLALTDDYGNPSGTLSITIPGPVVADTQAGFDSLIGRLGGTMTITGVPGNPGAVYIGGITAIPEPGSMAALAGLVLGCGGYSWRKRRAKQAA